MPDTVLFTVDVPLGGSSPRRAGRPGRCPENAGPPVGKGHGESFRSGGPDRPPFALESVQDLAEQEWRRRLDRAQESDPRVRVLIASLLFHALRPRSQSRRAAAEDSITSMRRALEAEGLSEDEIDRDFCELSCALWHVLLTTGVDVERAFQLREAIDGLLLQEIGREAVGRFDFVRKGLAEALETLDEADFGRSGSAGSGCGPRR